MFYIRLTNISAYVAMKIKLGIFLLPPPPPTHHQTLTYANGCGAQHHGHLDKFDKVLADIAAYWPPN